MLVYRIEDEKGWGAFAGLHHEHDIHAADEGVKTAFRHPSAHCGAEAGTALAKWAYIDGRGMRFACRSKPQLRMWFRSEAGRKAMADDGGVMVTYDVPEQHIIRGRYQLVFDPKHATKLSTVRADHW